VIGFDSRRLHRPRWLAAGERRKALLHKHGERHWVLEVAAIQPDATWVARDFHIRDGMMIDFDLTGQQLKKLGYVI
jgi:hypothetical protein